MLKELSSHEIAEWIAFFKYRDLVEANKQKNNESGNMSNYRPSQDEDIVYDQILPNDLFD